MKICPNCSNYLIEEDEMYCECTHCGYECDGSICNICEAEELCYN